jgi:hypothetical protein
MGAQSVYEGQPWQAAVLCVYPAPMLLALMASSAKRHQVRVAATCVGSLWVILAIRIMRKISLSVPSMQKQSA